MTPTQNPKHPTTSTTTSKHTPTTDLETSRINLFLHAENTRIFSPPQPRRLPVTLLTGFLGSGKTTLLKHILQNKSNLRIAAAINDFAALNIDENVIASTKQASKVVELTNGCICCHLLEDLKHVVWNMLQQGGDLDTDKINYLVVETSGVADPMRVVQTLDATFGKMFRARLDSVVTVVDADAWFHALQEKNDNDDNEVFPSEVHIQQLQRADVILMNKMDLLKTQTQISNNRKQDEEEAKTQWIKKRIQSYNPQAALYCTTKCKIPLWHILDVAPPSSSSEPNSLVPITHERTEIPWLVSTTGGTLRKPPSSSSSSSPHSHGTKPSSSSSPSPSPQQQHYSSLSFTQSTHPLSLSKLTSFLTSPAVLNLARLKGVLWIQGMHHSRSVVHLSGRGRLGFEWDGRWSGPPTSELALIGRDLGEEQGEEEDVWRERWEECVASNVNDTMSQGGDFSKKVEDMIEAQDEFELIHPQNRQQQEEEEPLLYFRLTGRRVYGYTDLEIARDLRIDVDAMNLDLVDAVNAATVLCGGSSHGSDDNTSNSHSESNSPLHVNGNNTDTPPQPAAALKAPSTNPNKAFLTYTKLKMDHGRTSHVVLCHPKDGGDMEPANNMQVLVREAKNVLQWHFRNVTVCKCGA